MQEQRECATAHVESLRTQARELKEQLTATKRDMRRAARTLKTYEVSTSPSAPPLRKESTAYSTLGLVLTNHASAHLVWQLKRRACL